MIVQALAPLTVCCTSASTTVAPFSPAGNQLLGEAALAMGSPAEARHHALIGVVWEDPLPILNLGSYQAFD